MRGINSQLQQLESYGLVRKHLPGLEVDGMTARASEQADGVDDIPLLEEFIRDAELQGLTDSTVDLYNSNLRTFLRWIHTEATTSHDRLSVFKAQLDSVGVKYELLSVTQASDPVELLTERQREFVIEALERGYYDSPRRCSLTDLAAALGVCKATASWILHRAEGTIIKEFMGGLSTTSV